MVSASKKITIVGGSGALGAGLAKRWARKGHQIIIGSRDEKRASEAASRLNNEAGTKTIVGMENRVASENGEIIVLTVPFSNHMSTLSLIAPALDNKILIDVTVPLVPPKVRTVHIPEGGSCAKAAQEFLGKAVRVVSAFQSVAATHLDDLEHEIDCDVLVCGNDPEAREVVVELASDADMKAWHAGVIANSIVAEAMTSSLIFMNNRYKIDGAGLRITGKPGSAG
ncbi:MAG: NADPH-dependent F420 reductase [Rhodospirillaceae bacterium]|nr:NADPH-dependent F420 reductase [Rhodospirillaceae bacterium]|tara:strand:- start:8227 stop:8904 length:678 start_codon:yes stop_codon:yes gene_type:complete